MRLANPVGPFALCALLRVGRVGAAHDQDGGIPGGGRAVEDLPAPRNSDCDRCGELLASQAFPCSADSFFDQLNLRISCRQPL